LNDFLVYVDETFRLERTPKGKGGPMARQHEENQRVVDYAFRDGPNLEVTLACVRAFPEVAAEVVARLTAALEQRLNEEGAGQWRVRAYRDAQGGPDFERLSITKDGWGDLRVVLTHDHAVPYDNQGRCAAYFQVRELPVKEIGQPSPGAEGFRARLIPILNERCGKGREDSGWWPKWYQYAGEFTRWDDPDVLLALSKNDQKDLDFFENSLATMMHAVEQARGELRPAR
jgi:hypothetical protein